MLSLYAAFPEDFDPETVPLLVTVDALEIPLWCERFERRGQTGAVASFADLDTGFLNSLSRIAPCWFLPSRSSSHISTSKAGA